MRLDDKVALVTGASRGIGLAIARRFAEAGASVMMSSRKPDALAGAAASIEGVTATFAANAGELDQAEACVEATLERFGRVDLLVNNAAANPYMGSTLGIEPGAYDKTFQVNVRGPLFWSKLCWDRSMAERGGGIINVSSIGGMSVEPGIGVYNATKAALLHLTRQLAAELAPTVRVNALAPGLVKTDMARSLWEPAEDKIAAKMPLRRLGEPDDVARAALFLASEASSWITGHTLVVDGGAMVGSPAL